MKTSSHLLAVHEAMALVATRLQKVALLSAAPLAIASFSTALPNAAEAASFSSLYIFGDSLTDTGNIYRATGNTIPPSPFYFDGRFSNGPLWVEYLAPKLGLTYNPATNFAFSSANTGTGNTFPLPLGFPGLQQEIQTFQATIPTPDPDALYIVFAGANDYLGGGITNPAEPVANLRTALTTLIAAGAKTILVPNLPDLGKLPGTLTDPQRSAGLTTLTNFHNAGLDQTLSGLSAAFPGTSLISLDVNGLFRQAIANPSQFNFTNATDSCLFPPPLRNPTGAIPTICPNPEQYVFWDDIHPTTATHAILGEVALTTLNNAAVPEPITVAGAIAAGALIGVAKRRAISNK
jgi:phospholipase/lecithinase/hemolysin